MERGRATLVLGDIWMGFIESMRIPDQVAD
jgi:hypothetical protein